MAPLRDNATRGRHVVVAVLLAATLPIGLAVTSSTEPSSNPSTTGAIPGDTAPIEWASVKASGIVVTGLANNGDLYTWAGNPYSMKFGEVPTPQGQGRKWSAAGAGDQAVYAISDGALYSMGINGSGLLGNGSDTGQHTTLTMIDDSREWLTVDGGSGFGVALAAGGELWNWGYGYQGRLGNGSQTSYNRPTKLTVTDPGTSRPEVWVGVATGSAHTLAVTASGHLYTWGLNYSGQIGNGTGAGGQWVGTPQLIASPDSTAWTDVYASSGDTSFGRTAAGNWYAWGRNDRGQLGLGSTDFVNRPTPLPLASTGGTLYPAFSTTFFISGDGVLYGAGGNESGQLGAAAPEDGSPVFVPISDRRWEFGAAFIGASNDPTDRHHLYGIGANWSYQLGNGTTAPASANDPAPVTRVKQDLVLDDALAEIETADAGSTLDLAGQAAASTGMSLLVTASGACRVEGTVVSFVGAGTCTLAIAQPGTSVYAPVVSELTIEVPPAATSTTTCPLETTTTAVATGQGSVPTTAPEGSDQVTSTTAPEGSDPSTSTSITTTTVRRLTPCEMQAPADVRFAG